MKRASSDGDDDDSVISDDNDRIKLKSILDDRYQRTAVTLVHVYVDTIVAASRTGRLIKYLNRFFPIARLRHLKRVSGNRIILMLAENLTVGQCVQLLKGSLPDTDGLTLKPERVNVPAELPLTRTQFMEACNYWPSLFREEKTIEKLLAGTFFNSIETNLILRNMEEAVATARKNRSTVGALVFDSRSSRTLAVSFDERVKHPMKHAAMVLIDKMATDSVNNRPRVNTTENCDFEGSGGLPGLDADVVTRSEGGVIRTSDSDEESYLLTGCDVYITREPCIMCTMALTHSRVKRVFYGCRSNNGGLGTLCKINVLPNLNHRYLAFADVLESECRSLLKYDDGKKSC